MFYAYFIEAGTGYPVTVSSRDYESLLVLIYGRALPPAGLPHIYWQESLP